MSNERNKCVFGVDRQTGGTLYVEESGALTPDRSRAAKLTTEEARQIARQPDLAQKRRVDVLIIGRL
jgi:hypothetical protein